MLFLYNCKPIVYIKRDDCAREKERERESLSKRARGSSGIYVRLLGGNLVWVRSPKRRLV